MKRSHDYWYQVLGQLNISKRDVSFFMIWTELGLIVEEIRRDLDFWKKMKSKLNKFYFDCLVPEI